MYRYIYIYMCNKYMDKYRVFTLIVFCKSQKVAAKVLQRTWSSKRWHLGTSAPWSVDIWRIEPDRTDGTWQVCHHRIKQLEVKIMVYPIFKTISFVSRSRPSRTRHQPAHPISSHSPRMEVHWWKPDKGRRWCRFRVAWPLPRPPKKKTSMSNLWSPAFLFSCLG